MFDIADEYVEKEQNRINREIPGCDIAVTDVCNDGFIIKFGNVKSVLLFLKAEKSVAEFKKNSKYAMYEIVDSAVVFNSHNSTFSFI